MVVKVTFKDGSVKFGEVEKVEGTVWFVKIGNDTYKLVEGFQTIEEMVMPDFDRNVFVNSKGVKIGWMQTKANQAKKYWKLFILKGLHLTWEGYTVWFTFSNKKGIYEARDLQKLLKKI